MGKLDDQLLAAFRARDEEHTGLVARAFVLQTFGKIGIDTVEVEQLMSAWSNSSKGVSSDTDIEYEPFVRWLVGQTASQEILDAGDESLVEPSAAVRLPAGGFLSWVDRCARLLETRDEADFIQKKLITAQVRRHLRKLGDSEVEAADGCLTGPPALERVRSKKASKSQNSMPSSTSLQWDGPALMSRLLKDGPKDIPVSFVEQVLDAVLDALPSRYSRPLVRLRVPKDGRVVVVGDTHGQLQDVLLIFLLYGMPTVENIFVFNGDVADRGPNACEIFLLIFAFFLGNPDTILLLRGNHEDEQMNMMRAEEGGGFYDECLGKYGEDVYVKFVEVFKLLPLASVVHEEVFIVHGGLPGGPSPSLESIDKIAHTEVCCPSPDADAEKDMLFLDLLWSDPHETPGYIPNPRGCGTLWGPDLTNAFLSENNLRWIIRSHQVPYDYERGWMEHHLGLVFTVFSASNYCGYEVNWGAVALLTLGSDGRVEQALREHNVPSLDDLAEVADIHDVQEREQKSRELGLSWVDGDRVAVGERRVRLALRRLAGIVLEHKPEFLQLLRSKDPKNIGSIDRGTWVDCLVKVCGPDLPWEEASKCWLPSNARRVDYRRFLDRFKVVLSQDRWCGWKSLVIAEVYEEMMSKNTAAHEILKLFDPSGTGLVSEETFMEVISKCCSGCLSEPQVAALSRTIFAHSCEQGFRVHDFLSRFTLAYVQSKEMTAVEGPLVGMAITIDQIGKLLFRSQSAASVAAVLGAPPPPDLLRHSSHPPLGIAEPPLPPQPPALDRYASVPPEQLQLSRQSSPTLVSVFQQLDSSGAGFVHVDDFVTHVMALPGLRSINHEGKPLDRASLKRIAQAIADSHSGDGTINLLQFARAFAAVDRSGRTDLADDLHEHILTFLYRHRHALRSSCAEHDFYSNGRVSKTDFRRVLEAVNFCTSKSARQLTRAQMDALVESIVEEDGHVEYEVFLASFEICIV